MFSKKPDFFAKKVFQKKPEMFFKKCSHIFRFSEMGKLCDFYSATCVFSAKITSEKVRGVLECILSEFRAKHFLFSILGSQSQYAREMEREG